MVSCLGWMAQLVGASSHAPKCCRFNTESGHIPRLQVQSPVRVHMGGNQLMFLSHISVSLSLSFSLSLPPFLSLSKINKHILGWGLKIKKRKKEKRKEKKRGILHIILTRVLGLLQPLECGRNNAVWHLKLAQKETWSFHLLLLWFFS